MLLGIADAAIIGRFLKNIRDSPFDMNEHIMIMFCDPLLLDNTVCIGVL
jgi:hypothetical protein